MLFVIKSIMSDDKYTEYTVRLPPSVPCDVREKVISEMKRSFFNFQDYGGDVTFEDNGKHRWTTDWVQGMCQHYGLESWSVSYYSPFYERTITLDWDGDDYMIDQGE